MFDRGTSRELIRDLESRAPKAYDKPAKVYPAIPLTSAERRSARGKTRTR